ncbi:molybdate ABC transporter substrate-binding protein [Malaciobacter molluscorum]|uniref:molybdate ABC transporter substrate-binding protein n=1 Tax=Malaciobacter molluscorum TaxID=1032072 RepID=UPI0018C89912|nr:molybdate ABC transporter substrate-binding protein [Malaciobacter molluscorum]
MKKLLLILFLPIVIINASDFKIAAGAGYKKPIQEILKLYNKNIDAFYGNMRQVSAQAKHTNLALIIGDKNFLQNKSNIDFIKYTTIGEGKAVLAYSKKIKINNLNEILLDKIKRVSIPHPKKAIYGIAAMQILKNSKIFLDIKEKLFITATVPQVTTYLITNEIDVGIINLTSALANKNKLGGYIKIDNKLYSKIDIVAASTGSCKKECKDFLKFIQTKKAKDIFTKFGL